MRSLRYLWHPALLTGITVLATAATGAADDDEPAPSAPGDCVAQAADGRIPKPPAEDRCHEVVPAPSLLENGSDASRPGTNWACRLAVDEGLQPFVQRARDGSATFREQCRKLAAAGAVVILRSTPERDVTRAESCIGLAAGGVIVARVRVRHGGDTAELIAHELEHVLERVEGVKHLMEASRGRSDVTLIGGAFETQRAIDAGRRVAREVEEATRRAEQARR
jgi:hypothetical protein